MSESLVIRLNTKSQLFVATFVSVLLFPFLTWGYIHTFSDFTLRGNLILLAILLSIIALPWIIFIFLQLFYKVDLHIDEKKITMQQKDKVYFEIAWDEIKSIRYKKIKWYHITSLFMFSMALFIEKKNVTKLNPKFADHYYFACMSKKDALKIKELFYPDLTIS